MKTMIFGYVGPINGLQSSLKEYNDQRIMFEMIGYFITTNFDLSYVTVEEVQDLLKDCGLPQIPTEYIQTVIDDLR